MVDALDSHKQSVDRLEEQHFYLAHTSFGAGGVRKTCAQGGVSSVAEDLRAASPVSPVSSLSGSLVRVPAGALRHTFE